MGIVGYTKFNSDLEFYDNNEFKLSYDDFYTSHDKLTDKIQGSYYKSIIMKLTYNCKLNRDETEYFFDNVGKITTGLFKASKFK